MPPKESQSPKTPDLEALEKLDTEITKLVNSGLKGKRVWRRACDLAVHYNPSIRREAAVSMLWCKDQ